MDYYDLNVDVFVVWRDSTLKKLFSNYPNITFENMGIQFSFPKSSNCDLAIAILDTIVDIEKNINYDENCVKININSMQEFIDNVKNFGIYTSSLKIGNRCELL